MTKTIFQLATESNLCNHANDWTQLYWFSNKAKIQHSWLKINWI